MKVINRANLMKRALEHIDKTSVCERKDADSKTMEKIITSAKEMRVAVGKSGKPDEEIVLVLMGSNVYTVAWIKGFANIVKTAFEEINPSEFDADTYIKELDEKDKRINSTK